MSERSTDSSPLRARSLAALHLAVALFGFAGLFGKWLALPPVTIVFGRTLVASVALAVLLGLTRERGASDRRRVDWRLAGNGAVLALHWVAFFQAIQTASVEYAAPRSTMRTMTTGASSSRAAVSALAGVASADGPNDPARRGPPTDDVVTRPRGRGRRHRSR